jgi:citrate lyase subunit beta/citryl-CoA lyase
MSRQAVIRPRRSVLYMPGSNPRALEKAASLAADGLILDLEDAVAPEAKAAARDLVAKAAGPDRASFGRREVIVRVNALDTPWGHDDVVAAARLKADAILFPKVSTPEDVMAAIRALEAAGAPESLPIWIMAETPRGILEIDRIAGAHPRLACIVAGTSDLARDLRARHTPGREGMLAALSLMVLAARAHGLDALDGVHLDLQDEAGFAAACEQGRNMGFDGKTLIHPKQLEAANRIFAPSAAELQTATKVVAAWNAARAEGKGVCVVDGKLIEKLHVEEYERMIALDQAIRGAAANAA